MIDVITLSDEEKLEKSLKCIDWIMARPGIKSRNSFGSSADNTAWPLKSGIEEASFREIVFLEVRHVRRMHVLGAA